MSGTIGELLGVPQRIKAKLVQQESECGVRNGKLQTNNWTRPSGKPSPPATRHRLFKPFAAVNRISSTCEFSSANRALSPSWKFRLTRHDPIHPTETKLYLRIQQVATPLLADGLH